MRTALIKRLDGTVMALLIAAHANFAIPISSDKETLLADNNFRDLGCAIVTPQDPFRNAPIAVHDQIGTTPIVRCCLTPMLPFVYKYAHPITSHPRHNHHQPPHSSFFCRAILYRS